MNGQYLYDLEEEKQFHSTKIVRTVLPRDSFLVDFAAVRLPGAGRTPDNDEQKDSDGRNADPSESRRPWSRWRRQVGDRGSSCDARREERIDMDARSIHRRGRGLAAQSLDERLNSWIGSGVEFSGEQLLVHVAMLHCPRPIPGSLHCLHQATRHTRVEGIVGGTQRAPPDLRPRVARPSRGLRQ